MPDSTKNNNQKSASGGDKQPKQNNNKRNQTIVSTVVGICAIAVVCLVVYLLGRTGVIRMNNGSGQASSAAQSVQSGTVTQSGTPAILPVEDTTASKAAARNKAENTAAVSEAVVAGETKAAAETKAAGEAKAAGETKATDETESAAETTKKKKKEEKAKEAAEEKAEEEKPEEISVFTTDSVNVRSGPSTDTEIVGKLLAGASVKKTGDEEDWSIVEYEGKKAYIKSEYLTEGKSYDTTWNLDDLDNEPVNFGYAQANRDENNVPTDWEWYESKWGQFNVDWIQDTSKKIIYLTMDEGFENDTTAGILDVLKEKGVKATFFLTKYFTDEMPEMVQRMIDEGHQLGNHTCTHPNMPNLSIEEQTDQVMTLQNMIKDQFGYDMKYFRYPEGVYSNQSLGLINNLGLKVVFWSYAYNDYSDEQPPVDESLAKAVDAVHPGAIYLLHASSTTNAAFLADFIDQCRDRGYEFGIYPDSAN